MVKRGFEDVDKRFGGIEKRFDGVDHRLINPESDATYLKRDGE